MSKSMVYEFMEKAKVALVESTKTLWKYFGIPKNELEAREKPDGTILTKTDIEAEQTIIKYLEYFINQWSYLGEEVGLIGNKDSAYQIAVDPLDGTANYYRARLNFGSSIALIDRNKNHDQMICVVTFEPALKRMWSAIKDEGAYLEQIDIGETRKIKVSDLDPHKGTLCYDASTKFGKTVHNSKHKAEILAKVIPHYKDIRMIGSNVLAHALVANGSFEAAVSDAIGGPYDIAGYLLVQEAGGTATNLLGNPINVLNDRLIVTSNGKKHNQLIQILQNIYSD
jgi:myo-inositol-1(or 4)-monophosphatase